MAEIRVFGVRKRLFLEGGIAMYEKLTSLLEDIKIDSIGKWIVDKENDKENLQVIETTLRNNSGNNLEEVLILFV